LTFDGYFADGTSVSGSPTVTSGSYSATFTSATLATGGTGTVTGTFVTRAVAVPEPSIYLLMFLGFGLLIVWHRQRLTSETGTAEA
jgi:hypothetical protein